MGGYQNGIVEISFVAFPKRNSAKKLNRHVLVDHPLSRLFGLARPRPTIGQRGGDWERAIPLSTALAFA
jgi:hypothetical protein